LDRSSRLSLICRVGGALCALPIDSTVETFRPLPVEPIAGAPASVLGLAIVRGQPMPVVDLAWLITGMRGSATRFVVVRTGERQVALAIDAVVGVRELGADQARGLPPLLDAGHAPTIAAIGALDRELFLVLQTARLMPEEPPAERPGERLAS
jgi:purine-binding chemotaxis protein CheW